MTTDAVIQLDHVSKRFPVRSPLLRRTVGSISAVDDVSLAVHRGEALGLVGESGSGKTTLGRLALRLTSVSDGRVLLDGTEITHLSRSQLRPYRRKIQVVFQDPYASFDPHATVLDSLRRTTQDACQRQPPAAPEAGRRSARPGRPAGGDALRYPHEFSGGQLQRIALARAIAVKPQVLVADEPVSSLDVSTQAQILELVRELQLELGMAVLFISHDLSVVRQLTTRVAVMYLGRLVEVGPTVEVTSDPKHPYTQALLSAVPIPDPDVQQQRKRIVLAGELPSPLHPPAGCRFHPRCPAAMDVCRHVDPTTITVGASSVSCHLYGDPPEETVT